MTTYSTGAIVLVEFPNTDGAKGKPRPALVILDTGDADVMLARITTQHQPSSFEVPLVDWRASGLRSPSTVRAHKLMTLHKIKIRQTIGRLSPPDRNSVADALKRILGNW
jgi:mRNA interferase MazF